MVTSTGTKPLATNANWLAVKPGTYQVGKVGTFSLYAWAKDAAGNVSDSMSFSVNVLTVEPSVNGYVRDTGGTPISGALIRLYDGLGYEQYTGSEANGYYEFFDVPSGTYYLTAKRDGYTYFTTTVNIE